MVICLERGADLRMAQLMPLLLTVYCFSKIQIGFTFLVPAHADSPGIVSVCVCVCVFRCNARLSLRDCVVARGDKHTGDGRRASGRWLESTGGGAGCRQFEKVRTEQKDHLMQMRKQARDEIERLAANHQLEPFGGLLDPPARLIANYLFS